MRSRMSSHSREDIRRIEEGLSELDVEPLVLNAIMDGVRDGTFANFSKAGHISTKAARNIIPGLLEGKVYSDACTAAGYDHAKERQIDMDAMTNPVAKRAVRETLKQVNALVRHYVFRPGHIHVELGRDVGKGPEERGDIERGIKRRTDERTAARKEFCEIAGKDRCSDGELQRYELWREQMNNCMFCTPERKISVEDLCDGRHAVEIEHILPRSRSHDNSWNNKVLACVKCNRDKKNRTPFEWFGEDEERWHEFTVRAKQLRADGKIKGFKIRNLLLRDFREREEEFLARNLNDTRYAARVVTQELRHLYTKEEQTAIDGHERRRFRRVFARPGSIAGALRNSWGLNRFKYLPGDAGKDKRVEDERHHAVDAIVLAACSEAMLQNLTLAIQNQRERGLAVGTLKEEYTPMPWAGFRLQVIEAHDHAVVARGENRRARGAGHAATIRQIREEDGRRIVYERVAVENVTEAALAKIKDPERNQDTIAALSDWIAAGKPTGELPRRNNGHPIKKVVLRSDKNPQTERAGFEAHKGLVDNADMVRVDVFEKEGKFYLVPIYAHQVADKAAWPDPPDRAISGGKPEAEWEQIDESFSFRFSLYPYSFVETVSSKGEVKDGYYRGTDRSTGAITLSAPHSRQVIIRQYRRSHSPSI